jgi:hypothetical protein
MRGPAIPRSESVLTSWFQNIIDKLATYQTKYGLTAPELAGHLADAEFGIFCIDRAALMKAEQQEWTAFKNEELYGELGGPTPTLPDVPAMPDVFPRPPGIMRRFADLANRIKNHPAYDPSDGEDLQIVGPLIDPPADPKPPLAGTALGGYQVRLEFKKSRWSGVRIEAKDENGNWQFLAIDLNSPYIDTRLPAVIGPPVKREYRAIYLDGDTPVGSYSDVVVVSAQE